METTEVLKSLKSQASLNGGRITFCEVALLLGASCGDIPCDACRDKTINEIINEWERSITKDPDYHSREKFTLPQDDIDKLKEKLIYDIEGNPFVRTRIYCRDCEYGKAPEIGCVMLDDKTGRAGRNPDGFCAWGVAR